ncbi:BrnT family toxin [Nitrosococcus wardiae]|uniref:BrnT family toxin n=1 Tax=Nitrosococcus wardiae TaxID=1814290 RepID=A0A4P7C0X0_9GAMM|nr:BrnT family toxin [Nitrosococcus wardiae]QBQ56238.1 BrnT family toxin [Nitrosococcus wardiae]
MDEDFELNGIKFIWNQEKARANRAKHKVAFKQAAEAFFDPFVRVVDASRHEEARDALIGMDKRWNLLFVVHVLLEEDKIRIISARKATRTKRQFYEN